MLRCPLSPSEDLTRRGILQAPSLCPRSGDSTSRTLVPGTPVVRRRSPPSASSQGPQRGDSQGVRGGQRGIGCAGRGGTDRCLVNTRPCHGCLSFPQIYSHSHPHPHSYPHSHSHSNSGRVPVRPVVTSCSQHTALAAEMADKKHLVVVGSANADIYLEIQRLPLAGETISASAGRTLPGGKGANQAACGARLGLPTYFLGQVGQDAYASLLEDSLAECGVKTEELRRVGGAPTGHAVVMLQPSGENSIIIVGGANTAWTRASDTKSFFSTGGRHLIRTAGSILLQREVPDEVNLEAAQIAHAAGVPVVLDVGGVEGPISDELLRCLAVLSPNETELQRVTGLPTGSHEEIKAAAQLLLNKGVPHVLVKLGSDGSLLLSRDASAGATAGASLAEIRQQVVPAPEVVDTTGAGDTFTAAFAVGLVEGMEHSKALQFASCAASLTVRKKGAMPSLPFREDVDSLYNLTYT